MKLEDKFREKLLGHLSDANTELDIKNAVDVCKDFTVSFISFLRENYYTEYETWSGDKLVNQEVQDKSTYEIMRTEKALEIYLNQE